MSHAWRMRVRVEQITSERTVPLVREVIDSVACWLSGEREEEYSSSYQAPGKEQAYLLELEGRVTGRDTTESSREIRDEVWKALGEFVPVEVLWWDDEREPDEVEIFDVEDYGDWLDQKAKEPKEDAAPEEPAVGHTWVDAATQPPVFRCSHCGKTEGIGLPLDVSTLTGRGDAFTAKHAGCPKPEEETPA